MTYTEACNMLVETGQIIGAFPHCRKLRCLTARYMIGAETVESIRALGEPQIVCSSRYQGQPDHHLPALLTKDQVDRILQLSGKRYEDKPR